MVFCSLDTLKKFAKKKETRIKKEIVECFNKLVNVERDQDDGIVGFDVGFVGYNKANFNFIF